MAKKKLSNAFAAIGRRVRAIGQRVAFIPGGHTLLVEAIVRVRILNDIEFRAFNYAGSFDP